MKRVKLKNINVLFFSKSYRETVYEQVLKLLNFLV